MADAGFFTPEPVFYRGGGEGFALFGAEHLVALAVCAALVIALVVWYRAVAPSRRKILLCAIAGAALALLVAKDVSYIALGLFEPLFWPLHICNFCEYLALAAAIAHGSKAGHTWWGLLFCWATLGCTGALLFPGWRYYTPALTWASVSGFAEHALVLACALCPLAAHEEAPRFEDIRNSALAALACGALARRINPLLGTNFFFVTRPASVGGPFIWLADTFGDPWFLVAYLGIACAFWFVLCLACAARPKDPS